MSEQQRHIGINGAGAIGTSLLRRNAVLARDGRGLPITAVAEEYFSPQQIAENVRHDPIYGALGIDVDVKGDTIKIGSDRIQVIRGGVKSHVEWKRHNIWSVLEATGQLVESEKARVHITHGEAEKVIITAPSKGVPPAKSLIVGVNEQEYDPRTDNVVDNASCTTKSAAHILKALQETVGVRSVSLATVHAETGPERRSLIQLSGRVAQISQLGFRPERTGAQVALTKLFPGVSVNAKAYRVPVPDASISDMTIRLQRASSIEEIRSIITSAARAWTLQVLELSIANSADLIGNPHDCVVSLPDIDMVMDDEVRMRAGYDNGFAPANAALELQRYMLKQ